MRKRIMIIMVMSALDGERSFGGVDSACQAHLQGLIDINDDNCEYLIVAFNAANDLAEDERHLCLATNINLRWYNYARKTDKYEKLPNVLKNELLIRSLIKQFKPDIVHSHLPQWHIKKWAAEKKILTLHQYHNIGRTPVGLFNDLLHRDIIEPASIKNSDSLTAVSQDVIDAVHSLVDTKIHYIPNAINHHYLSFERTTVQDSRINLLMTGTLCRAKRVMDALEVVRRLKTEHSEIRLTLAGKFGADQNFNERFLDFIKDHSLDKNLHIAGTLSLTDMMAQMKQTHIGLFLSEEETFGLAGLECLAAGIPLVTTRVGIFKRQARDFTRLGVDIVEVGDIPAIVDAVSKRIKAKAYDAGAEIRNFLNESFSRKACALKYHEIYKSL